ncbi:MAG: hypothetical protein JW891_09615 [Candidatus Lokiarchaeota archaeon]|nr:hypothetical protein [Candidatus Lokiarchaeota archaeon]
MSILLVDSIDVKFKKNLNEKQCCSTIVHPQSLRSFEEKINKINELQEEYR